jgi:hypothetical protein
MQVAASVASKLEKELALMAAVRDVPDVARYKVAVSSWHLFS